MTATVNLSRAKTCDQQSWTSDQLQRRRTITTFLVEELSRGLDLPKKGRKLSIRGLIRDVSRPPIRDFKLSVGVHDVPKTSRTRCDNAHTTTSPYKKVGVKFQNIYGQSKSSLNLVACFSFLHAEYVPKKKSFQICSSLTWNHLKHN